MRAFPALRLALALVVIGAAAGVSDVRRAAAQPATSDATGRASPGAPERGAAEPRTFVLLQTSVGPVVLELFDELAPRHAKQIRHLVELGVYDGVPFYRIHSGFVAQIAEAGSREKPLSPEQAAALTPIPGEFSDRPHLRGILSMAHGDDPDSAVSSFSILLGPAPHLDGKYTVFGRVLGSEDTMKEIDAAAGANPVAPRLQIRIHSAQIVDAATAEILSATADVSSRKTGERVSAAASRTRPATGGSGAVLALAVAVAMLALSTGLIAIRAGGRALISFALATFLVAFFLVYTLITNEIEAHRTLRPWVGTLLFVAAILGFKLMGQFDSEGRRGVGGEGTRPGS